MKEIPHYFALTEKQGNLSDLSEKLDSYGEPRFLQDSKNHNYGKTEHLWLAGSVTAENVRLLCENFQPELVDVSSGIEDEGKVGIKNGQKMRKFFKEVK